MSAVARLTAFVLALGALFAVAALAGRAADPDVDHEPREAHAGEAPAASHADEGKEAGHGSEPATATPVKGLAVTADGYTLDLFERRLPVDRTTRLRFRILRDDGRPVRRYAVEHERRMHLIVVRRDGSQFQHLHPRLRPDGTWTQAIRLPRAGSYRVFADFTTGGRDVTLGADLAADGRVRHTPLPPERRQATTPTGYEVDLEARSARAGQSAVLRFTVRRDGRVVRTQPYLGAGGHLVALREGDLAYLHTHPIEGGDGDGDAVEFETGFPTAARYRLYFQFRAGGRVHTAEFTRRVER